MNLAKAVERPGGTAAPQEEAGRMDAGQVDAGQMEVCRMEAG
jgi:hypothetical protein